MSLLWAIFRRDVTLAFRRGGGAWNAALFFALTLTFFAFGLNVPVVQEHAASLACVAAFFAVLLAAANLFEGDADDGTLEQYLLLPVAFELIVLTKLAAAWCSQLLSLVLVAPIAVGIAATPAHSAELATALLLATPSLLAIAGFGSALTLGSRKAGLVQALIALPLYVPIIIFASAHAEGTGGAMPFAMLLALLMLLFPVACLAIAALLRMARE